jgi:hypothetical protein
MLLAVSKVTIEASNYELDNRFDCRGNRRSHSSTETRWPDFAFEKINHAFCNGFPIP